MVKSVLAIICGFVAFVTVTFWFANVFLLSPHWDLLLFAGAFMGGTIGGCVSALIAENAVLKHALALTGLVLVLVIVRAGAESASIDGWMLAVTLVGILLGASAGGYISKRQARATVSRVTYDEAFRVSWALLWPTVVLSLVFQALIEGVSKVPWGRHQIAAALIAQLVAITAIFPLIAGRAVAKAYRGFYFKVVHNDGATSASNEGTANKTLRFGEKLRMAWLVIWRYSSLVAALALAVLATHISADSRVRTGFSLLSLSQLDAPLPSEFSRDILRVFSTWFLVAPFGSLFFVGPLVTRMMLRKRYRGYHFEIVRADAKPAA